MNQLPILIHRDEVKLMLEEQERRLAPSTLAQENVSLKARIEEIRKDASDALVAYQDGEPSEVVVRLLRSVVSRAWVT